MEQKSQRNHELSTGGSAHKQLQLASNAAIRTGLAASIEAVGFPKTVVNALSQIGAATQTGWANIAGDDLNVTTAIGQLERLAFVLRHAGQATHNEDGTAMAVGFGNHVAIVEELDGINSGGRTSVTLKYGFRFISNGEDASHVLYFTTTDRARSMSRLDRVARCDCDECKEGLSNE